MKRLSRQANLSALVYQALADEIVSGRLRAGVHLRQEELAARLGVSRQPVQQAMVMVLMVLMQWRSIQPCSMMQKSSSLSQIMPPGILSVLIRKLIIVGGGNWHHPAPF